MKDFSVGGFGDSGPADERTIRFSLLVGDRNFGWTSFETYAVDWGSDRRSTWKGNGLIGIR